MGREARAKRTDDTASDKRSQLSTLFERAKRATVAIAFMRPAKSPTNNPPFEIVGSGVCIDEKGVVITCRHVLQSFVRKDLDAISLPSGGQPHRERVPIVGVPHALFYVLNPASTEVVVECVSLQTCETTPERDICVAWVSPCERFASSFPALAIEDFGEIHEGMELATCGFPLGNVLFKQLGTVSSSFTRGSLSSIVPVASASREQVKGFQLDLRATHGNSGGPVFSTATGKVIGILQGGTTDKYGQPLFSYAESIYWPIDRGMVNHVLNPPKPPSSS